MTVKIRVVEQDTRGEHEVEVRTVTTESGRRLTAKVATKILRREFPDIAHQTTFTALKSKTEQGTFWAMHSVRPTEKCSFHYIWRRYYLCEDKT